LGDGFIQQQRRHIRWLTHSPCHISRPVSTTIVCFFSHKFPRVLQVDVGSVPVQGNVGNWLESGKWRDQVWEINVCGGQRVKSLRSWVS